MLEHTYSNGKGEWNVFRLWELAAGLPVKEWDPEAFHEWEDWAWGELNLGSFASHMRRVQDADLSYPVILSAEGNVMDGCHRIVKAWLKGVPVRAVQFDETPPPDRLLEK